MRGVLQDLHHAGRLLVKSPGFTATAILTLALGIAANTAVFSIVRGAMLRPLPYSHPERLVDVLDRGIHESNLSKLFASYADFEEYRRQARSFDGLAAATWAVRGPILTGIGDARGVLAIPVSQSFFDVLGVKPALGRTFSPSDVTGGCSVVVSHAFWATSLGADRAIPGRTILLDRRPCAVLGVMPPGFAYYPAAAEMWSLIQPDTAANPAPKIVVMVGRLRPGVTTWQAEQELARLHTALHRGDPERDLGPAVNGLQEDFTWLAGRNLKATLWILLAAVGLVLTIACFNVGCLLLARTSSRSSEMAIRAALGGGRARLFRQLLTESLLLAALGGACGIALAFAAVRYFLAAKPVELPVGANITIQWPVLLFAIALATVTAVLFGLAPAWQASAVDLASAIRSGGRGTVGGVVRQRLTRAMVMAEVMVSVLLLAGSGLLLESVLRFGGASLGFQPAGVYTANISLPEDRYKDPALRLHFYDSLEARLSATAGIQSVAFASMLPPATGGTRVLQILEKPVPPGASLHDIASQTVSPGYFRTLGVPLLRGRLFDTQDRAGSEPVALVDEALARQYFDGSNPIGFHIRLADDENWAAVIGVVGTQKRITVYQEMSWVDAPTVFRPLVQNPPANPVLAVRTGNGAAEALRRAVSSVDPEISLGKVESMEEQIANVLAFPRFRAIVLGAFAAFSLLLAAAGLYGTLSQMVARRTPEIGIRMAVGASRGDIVRLVLRHAGIPVAGGLASGLVCAALLGHFLNSMLYGVRPRDPLTLALASLALLAAAAGAIWIPTRRAAAVDPMQALRQE